ncbi:MAG TPA: hypothetical protein VMY39_05405 [Planctomycetota bacterium]|nr:hypothetical protein [Planctomycetota bacterium]
MSAFEATCWAWYVDNVTPFMLEAGLAAEEFRGLGLAGPARRIFIMGLNRIHSTFARVSAERARDSMRK